MSWPTGTMPVLRIAPDEVISGSDTIPDEVYGEVLVEVAYLGICGTDVELLKNKSYYIQQGLSTYPLIFGHEWTGTVAAVAPGVDSVQPGDQVIGQTIVTCGSCPACQEGRRTSCAQRAEVGLFGRQGAAARYISLPATAITKLTPEASLLDSVLIEPGVTAMSAIKRTRCAFDDTVVVIGTGTLGLIAAAIALNITENVDVVGIEEAGLDLARSLGVRQALHPDQVERDQYSVAIEASGVQSSLGLLGNILRPGGRGALVGVINGGAPEFIPAFVTLKDISLFGILHGLEHYQRVGALIDSKVIPAETLIDRVLPWTEARDAFELMVSRQLKRPKIILDLRSMSER